MQIILERFLICLGEILVFISQKKEQLDLDLIARMKKFEEK